MAVYSVANDTLNGKVDEDSLMLEISQAAIVPALDNLSLVVDVLTLTFKAALSGAEQTTLDGVVAAHTGVSLEPEPEPVQPEIAILKSGSIRTVSSFVKVDLNKNSQSFNDVYSSSGEGSLHGFWMAFNSDNVLLRLEVDGQEILQVDCDELESYSSDGLTSFGWLSWSKDKNTVKYNPAYPLKFYTNVKIQAKANSNSNGRDMKGYIVDIEVPS